MKQQTVVALLTTVLLAGGLSACANTGVPVPADTPSATEEPTAEATAAPPEETQPATERPATEVTPGAAATSTPAAAGEPPATERLKFAPGATQLNVAVNVASGETASYVLRVSEDQLMDVSCETADTPVQLTVYGADGTVLKSGMSESTSFRGTVPSTQDYLVDVTAGTVPVSTTMTVVIPQRITFGEGDTAAVVEGDLGAQGIEHYVLNVAADQLVEVSVEPQDSVRLVIYGVDGTVLHSGMGEGAFFRGTVPTTQDYLVDVSAASAVSYTINVLIPERITFGAGETSAELSGSLDATSSRTYVINAEAGQTLQVNVSPDGAVQSIVYGVDGTVLKSGMGGGSDFSGELPTTQDYIITIRSGPDAVDYDMVVTVQ